MVDPVPMTMREILSMWLDVGHKMQKRPPDLVTGYEVDGEQVGVGQLQEYIKLNKGQSFEYLVR